MILRVQPAAFLQGTVSLPPSKSYTIRALIVAALGGVSKIIQPSYCDDALVAMATARWLGANLVPKTRRVIIVKANQKKTRLKTIHVGESGTVLRLVLPLASLKGEKVRIVGKGTLRGRPNRFLSQLLRERGVDIKGFGPQESVPIEIRGGQFQGGEMNIDGSVSSQFISALLLACPNLGENTHLRIKGNQVVSETYILMTRQILAKAGIKIIVKSDREFLIPGRQKYRGLKNFAVPSDYGLGAFLMAAAALTKSEIVLQGHLKNDLIQSDAAILPLLKKMGVRFTKTSRTLRFNGPSLLRGGEFSLKDCPDLLPVLVVLAMFADSPSRFYDIGHARIKESDRISDLRTELLKVGADIKEKADELIVHPQPAYRLECLLDPHHDHRLAMAFCVLGIKVGVSVKDIECVSKSYPEFIRDLKALGAKAGKSQKLV